MEARQRVGQSARAKTSRATCPDPGRYDNSVQAGLLALGSADTPRLLFALGENGICGGRPRLQRRDRGGFAPPSLLNLPTRETHTNYYSIVRYRRARFARRSPESYPIRYLNVKMNTRKQKKGAAPSPHGTTPLPNSSNPLREARGGSNLAAEAVPNDRRRLPAGCRSHTIVAFRDVRG